ncbi:unnamed protein product [Mycena citricolor]|uniref:Uncharacterized protein n=1 Tax=Mycena citricolor TaxID=2018698 RepID=A0AAD2H6F4_9AGAR|nr:unnamed protein product [Mycena citricolor]
MVSTRPTHSPIHPSPRLRSISSMRSSVRSVPETGTPNPERANPHPRLQSVHRLARPLFCVGKLRPQFHGCAHRREFPPAFPPTPIHAKLIRQMNLLPAVSFHHERRPRESSSSTACVRAGRSRQQGKRAREVHGHPACAPAWPSSSASKRPPPSACARLAAASARRSVSATVSERRR